MSQCILVVEDDAELSELVALHLRRAGYEVLQAGDGEAALARVRDDRCDLVVLDLMLPPGPDGLAICRSIRDRSAWLPILILTARGEEVDRIVGLELGADDYVTKPFSVRELVARVGALLRRVDALRRPERGREEPAISVGSLAIDPSRRRVSLEGSEIELTPKEFDLLVYFARHPGRVFTRAGLLEQIWGYSHDGYGHTVNSHINRLRSKLEPDPANPRYILTVWGVGYKFRDRAPAGAGTGTRIGTGSGSDTGEAH